MAVLKCLDCLQQLYHALLGGLVGMLGKSTVLHDSSQSVALMVTSMFSSLTLPISLPLSAKAFSMGLSHVDRVCASYPSTAVCGRHGALSELKVRRLKAALG